MHAWMMCNVVIWYCDNIMVTRLCVYELQTGRGAHGDSAGDNERTLARGF